MNYGNNIYCKKGVDPYSLPSLVYSLGERERPSLCFFPLPSDEVRLYNTSKTTVVPKRHKDSRFKGSTLSSRLKGVASSLIRFSQYLSGELGKRT